MFDSRANPQFVKIQYIYQQLVETKWNQFFNRRGFWDITLKLVKTDCFNKTVMDHWLSA